MRFLGNVIWLVFGGFFAGLGYIHQAGLGQYGSVWQESGRRCGERNSAIYCFQHLLARLLWLGNRPTTPRFSGFAGDYHYRYPLCFTARQTDSAGPVSVWTAFALERPSIGLITKDRPAGRSFFVAKSHVVAAVIMKSTCTSI